MHRDEQGFWRSLAGVVAALAALSSACGPAGAGAATGSTTGTTRGELASTTNTTLPPPVQRFALAGDSVAVSLWPSLRAAFAEVDPRVAEPHGRILAVLGFGLTADTAGWSPNGAPVPAPEPWAGWMDRMRVTLAEERPDVVVVLEGVWDAIAREIGGVRTDPGTPAWRAWYRPRILAAADAYASAGSKVVWLLPQCTGEPWRDGFLAAVREEMRAALAARPAVSIVDLGALACPDGRPVHSVATRSGSVPLLEPNGVHFAHGDAVPAIAPWLVRELRRVLALPEPAAQRAPT
jgi:hypothetical protein